jgi:hypothetical protein
MKGTVVRYFIVVFSLDNKNKIKPERVKNIVSTQYNTIQYNTIQFNTIQYDTIDGTVRRAHKQTSKKRLTSLKEEPPNGVGIAFILSV